MPEHVLVSSCQSQAPLPVLWQRNSTPKHPALERWKFRSYLQPQLAPPNISPLVTFGTALAHANTSPKIRAPARHSRELLKDFITNFPFQDNYPIKSQKNQLQNKNTSFKNDKTIFYFTRPLAIPPFIFPSFSQHEQLTEKCRHHRGIAKKSQNIRKKI